MKTFRSLEEVPADFGPTVVSVGNFDGVHRGHQLVLQRVRERARTVGCKSVALTFEPHPLRILRPESAPRLITPPALKEALLAQAGVDALVSLPFTRDFSITTAQDFARNILAGRLHAREVHEGENFHFGRNAEGNVQGLESFGRQFGFEVKTYSVMMLRGEMVSSSHIRELIAQGKVDRACRLLGRPFSITAPPGRGRGYGHKYTVPTINLSHYGELVPGDGVYFTRTRVDQEAFNSLTNIGRRPTFGDELFAIETHLLDFHPLEITSQTEVEISFLRWHRPEVKFASVEALKSQIGKDVRKATRFFRLLGRTKPAISK